MKPLYIATPEYNTGDTITLFGQGETPDIALRDLRSCYEYDDYHKRCSEGEQLPPVQVFEALQRGTVEYDEANTFGEDWDWMLGDCVDEAEQPLRSIYQIEISK